MLSKVCRQRRGAERFETRIACADLAQLESWCDKLIAGENLEELLGEGGP